MRRRAHPVGDWFCNFPDDAKGGGKTTKKKKTEVEKEQENTRERNKKRAATHPGTTNHYNTPLTTRDFSFPS